MKKYIQYFPVILAVAIGCSTKQKQDQEVVVEAKPVLTSLLGKVFYKPEWPAQTKAKLDSNLRVAKGNFASNPSEDNYIWLGRRYAYLYDYDSAMNIFNQGIAKFPNSFRLYRHRGHRYITLRKFDEAIADLRKASELMKDAPLEIEPDGAPNKLNQPLSSTQFNVWYHLGLGYYLKGEFDKAEQAYIECMKVSNNDDLLTATTDWLYMTYCREGKMQEAKRILDPIKDNMNLIENESYYNRLKMYQGKIKPGDLLTVQGNDEEANLVMATQGYGVGNWYLCNGEKERAQEIFTRVTNGKHFASFGFIAAEVELTR